MHLNFLFMSSHITACSPVVQENVVLRSFIMNLFLLASTGNMVQCLYFEHCEGILKSK